MKHGFITSLQSNRHSTEGTATGKSRLNRRKTQISASKVLASVFWDAQGILFIVYLETNSKYYIVILVHLKEKIEKKNPATNEEKSALSPRQYTVSQVDCNEVKTTWIALRIAFAPTLCSRSGPKQLLAVCRPQRKRFGSNEEGITETEASNCQRSVGISVSPEKETMLSNKVEYFLKVVFIS